MKRLRRLTLELLALAVFALGLIWMAGSGEAVQSTSAEAEVVYRQFQNTLASAEQVMASTGDTTNIKATEGTDSLHMPKEADDRETLFKNIKLFNSMAYQIKNRYMEDIDAKDLIQAGIRGMLQNLDPFSVLMEEKSYDRLMESTHGKYEGLGMQIDARDDRIRIISPIEGTPAYKKGLQAGDVLWEINGKSTLKMNTQDAATLMRGPAGTSVNLKIHREGVPELLDYDIERAVIELKSVNYYGFFEGTNIGYIRLSRFAEETGNELRAAISALTAQKPLDGLVFDLRSNGGGLLQEAVETANLFLEKDKLVVYTLGRTPDTERRYYSDKDPMIPKGKLVILVDEGTASASEIVSGAIQDWDRGIIMGQTTYGKGLVQQIFPAGGDYAVALKLTTAKYYVPSGRCIQKPERDKKQTEAMADDDTTPDTTKAADSLNVTKKQVFFTNGGRTVYGGGGVVPDVELPREKWYPIEMNLERKMLFFDFAVKYTVAHPEIGRNFEVTDKVMDDFKAFVKEKNFDYKTSLEVSLDKMRDVVKDENKADMFNPTLDQLTGLIKKEKETDFERSKDYIKRAIKREVIAKLFGEQGMYQEIILKTDPAVKKAVELLKNEKEYTGLVTGEKAKAEVNSTTKKN
jgi:carboxyl-terminal processing protease